MAIRVKPFKSSTAGLTPPAPGSIRAGIPDGRTATLGATLGVPVVEDDVAVGTWSGSVSDRLSEVDSLMLEKIRDVWVNHSNWVLVGVGVGVEIGLINKESKVDDEGRPELSEGKMMLFKSQHRETISRKAQIPWDGCGAIWGQRDTSRGRKFRGRRLSGHRGLGSGRQCGERGEVGANR